MNSIGSSVYSVNLDLKDWPIGNLIYGDFVVIRIYLSTLFLINELACTLRFNQILNLSYY